MSPNDVFLLEKRKFISEYLIVEVFGGGQKIFFVPIKEESAEFIISYYLAGGDIPNAPDMVTRDEMLLLRSVLV